MSRGMVFVLIWLVVAALVLFVPAMRNQAAGVDCGVMGWSPLGDC